MAFRLPLPSAALAIALLAAGCAMAQPQGGQPADATLLNLSETAERDVTPDTIRARLLAQVSSEQAAVAQNAVNAAMTKALAKARALGLEVETGGYSTYQETPPRPQNLPPGTKPPAAQWRAQQSLVVISKDDAKLLEAVGALQNDGLLLQELGYTVSREQQRSLQDELTAEALQRLEARAKKAAAALHLRFDGWARVGINGGVVPPQPMFKAMRAETMAAAAPPVAAAGEQTVSVNVSGEAILRRD
ncbi:MAG TPA: SIMPL domain-containing protein [Ferrovibrio sp.]|jgi:predicted secreted protein|uniref:SIMPL domain-containing protein n=1 Tax=Ferrovibrio sp. TaxID=1917215 RepID=UPI002ED296C0